MCNNEQKANELFIKGDKKMKNDLRVIKTKENLQNALLYLLEEKDLEKISISELCKEARVNRGTFYLHFDSVEDLFSLYFQEITEDLRRAYDEPYERVNYKLQDLEAHMIRIFHHVQKFADFYTIVFNQKSPLMYYYDLLDVIRERIMKSLEIEESVIEKNYHASYQANAILGIVMEWVTGDYKETAEELNELILKFSKYYSV